MSLSEAVSPKGGSDDLSQIGVRQMKEVRKTEEPAAVTEKETLPLQEEVVAEGKAPDPEDLAAQAYMKWLIEEGGKEVHGKRAAFEEKYPQYKR